MDKLPLPPGFEEDAHVRFLPHSRHIDVRALPLRVSEYEPLYGKEFIIADVCETDMCEGWCVTLLDGPGESDGAGPKRRWAYRHTLDNQLTNAFEVIPQALKSKKDIDDLYCLL